MTKHKKTKRRVQKGGEWYNPASWFNTDDPNAPKQSWGDWFSGTTNSAENALGNAASSIQTKMSNALVSAKNIVNTDVSLTGSQNVSVPASNQDSQSEQSLQPLQTSQSTQSTYGGKKHRKSRKMKGGKGGLGLTYYAAPVSGLKVASPNSWQFYADGTNQYSLKGGSRKRRRTRRHIKR